MKIITALAVLSVTAGIAVPAAQSLDHASPAVATFVEATRTYAQLHRHVERLLEPVTINSTATEIERAVTALAAAIRVERAAAKQGDLFTPALAHELRARVQTALVSHGLTADDLRLSERVDDVDLSLVKLGVNGTFPWIVASALFPSVLEALPALPPELQYRIVGDTLVLIDVHASLVVDLLPHALAETTVLSAGRGNFPAGAKIPQRR